MQDVVYTETPDQLSTPFDDQLLLAIRTAITQPCPTTDKAEQQYVVCLSAVNQYNVDTEELIWPKHPNDPLQDDEVPLAIITQADLWQQAQEHWLAHDPIAWTAFVWRIAVPLANRLGVVGSWR